MESEKEFLKKNSKNKFIKMVFILVFVFILAGISSIITDRYIFPRLSSLDWLKKKSIFKSALENVTVINKTEQVTVNESNDVSNYTDKSASSVVEIVKQPADLKKYSSGEIQSASGIIVTADGLVASFGENFFNGKDEKYKVYTQDGRGYSAKLMILDSYSDIALLKLENAQNLPVAEFMASEDVKTGMKIVFIGRSGFDAEISLKLGITSEMAKGYSLSGPLASSEKLQGVLFADFDSLIGFNSMMIGGPAVDQNGNVLGIIGNRKEEQGRRNLIVPVNHLKYVVDEYLQKGEVKRGTFGTYYSPLSKETAFASGSNFEKGALIYSPSGQQGLAVMAGSAAEAAGVKIGDVILSVNGEEVNPDQNLAYLVSKYKPGDAISLKINRSGQEMEVRAILQ